MKRFRSWLFVPGHKEQMVGKAAASNADIVILDLEDGVPPPAKKTARDIVESAITRWSSRSQTFVRTHPLGKKPLEKDLKSVVRHGLSGLVVPKVKTPEELVALDGLLQEREKLAGMYVHSVAVLVTIESAQGLINSPTIAGTSTRLVGLMLGAEDYALDVGLCGTEVGRGLDHARASLAVASASAGIQAIDKVFGDVKDAEGLARETREARGLGFTGKALIHPDQINVVHDAFRPSKSETQAARRIVAAFERQKDFSPITVDGKMVDLPIVERSRSILKSWEENI